VYINEKNVERKSDMNIPYEWPRNQIKEIIFIIHDNVKKMLRLVV